MAIKSFNRLASAALALPTRQRAQLVRALWNSLDTKVKGGRVEPHLLEIVRRRDREISQGKVKCKTHEEVMKAARKCIEC